MSYITTKRCIALFLAAYFAIGVAARLTSSGTEDVYPFFSWFLFAEVPSRFQSSFVIMIREIDGQKQEPPAPLSQFPQLYGGGGPGELFALVQAFGRSVQGHDTNAPRIRREIETRFGRPVAYDLVAQRYDALKKWRTNEAEEKVVASFKTGI